MNAISVVRCGQRSPHKPLLVLYGSSAVAWLAAAEKLADLIRDHGPPSATSLAQRAAYPFTRLRSDGICSSIDRPLTSPGCRRTIRLIAGYTGLIRKIA